MRSEPVDVLVAGAGPTGLTLALQAADHGASVRVVERRRELYRPSRALIVHSRTLEVLRPLGVTDALLASGDVAPSAQLHFRAGLVRARLDTFDLPDSAFPHLLLIRQADVEAVLAQALSARGIDIEWGAELVDAAARDGHAVATIRGRDDAEARYLVGCDGAGSLVRRAAGMGWAGRAYRQEVVLADLELDGDLEAGVIHAVPTADGLVFLFACGERAPWRLLATRQVDRNGSAGSTGAAVQLDVLAALLEQAGLRCAIAGAPWSARVPLQHRLAGRFRVGPLFVAGDAAHVHSPAGGQGMNTGMQDAANLGWKLAFAARTAGRPARVETLLNSYELERRPVARRVLAMTRIVFWAEAATDPAARAVRTSVASVGYTLLPILLARQRLLVHGVRTLSQLRVHYRRSPISIDGVARRRGALRAGERLPDGPITTPAGHARLHELLAHPGIHVLVDRDARLPLDGLPLEAPLRPDIQVYRRISSSGTGVVAVRPDGYVGFTGDGSPPDGLVSWLDLVHPGRPGATAGTRSSVGTQNP
jgi:2-polyprenyl-6-methoxyphenol hydroxylase-like FAD-dependent oxidoreductase